MWLLWIMWWLVFRNWSARRIHQGILRDLWHLVRDAKWHRLASILLKFFRRKFQSWLCKVSPDVDVVLGTSGVIRLQHFLWHRMCGNQLILGSKS